jgi:hypothetical protein
MRTLAIDCDLHKLYAVTSDGEIVCKADPGLQNIMAWAKEVDLILFEIASAVDYTKDQGPAVAHNKRRWTIFNAAMAMALQCWLPDKRLLVAPSSAWTCGFELKTRHAMAKCKQKQKDLREAEAMIWFHAARPEKWCSLTDFLTAL